ncbi:hypothetical protein NI18_21535 [Sphingomonas sp. Ant20]|nr:hypothetical protein NI18_21535 [Sphingomonas sp. Ant20]
MAAEGNETKLVLFPYSGHDFNTTFDSVTNQTMIQTVARFLTDNNVGPDPNVAARSQTTDNRS